MDKQNHCLVGADQQLPGQSTTNVANVQKDNPLHSEIVNMRQAKIKAKQNILNHRTQLEIEQKRETELKTLRTNLQKQVIELEHTLTSERQSLVEMQAHDAQLRDKCRKIGNFCVSNETVIKQCSQSKATITERLGRTRNQIKSNLSKFEEILASKQNEIANMKQILQCKQEEHRHNTEIYKARHLELAQQLKNYDAEVNGLKRYHEEHLQSIKNCADAKEVQIEKRRQLEEELKNKQLRSQEMLQDIKEDLHKFEECKEQISSSLRNTDHALEMKHLSIKSVEHEISKQTEYRANVQEKINAKEKQVEDLKLQNKYLENSLCENKEKHAQELQILKDLHIAELERKENITAKLAEEQKIVNETDKVLEEIPLKINELTQQIDEQKQKVADLKEQHEKQLEDIVINEFKKSIFTLEINKIKEKQNQEQDEAHESDSDQLLEARIADANDIVAKLEEQIKTDEKQATKAVLDKIGLMERNFAVKTKDQREKFEKNQNQLQDSLESLKQKLAHKTNLYAELEKELNRLEKECKQMEIKMESTNSDSPKGRLLRSRVPNLYPPPVTRNRKRDIDEQSFSSVEGVVVTIKDIVSAKQRRIARLQ